MSEQPDITVIVTIVDGGNTLKACLEALEQQVGGHKLEVLIPYDHLTRSDAALAARFPQYQFIDLGEPFNGLIPSNPLEMHRFYDKRRAEGLIRATAPLIGILEDCGYPTANWIDAMLKLHTENEEGVIGGAVIQGIDRLRNWANFFCDFSRYHPPLDEKNPEYVTSTNIVYKRDAIMSVRDMWEGKIYQEVLVNWELRKKGVGTMLNDLAVTESHRKIENVFTVSNEMFHWGRMYGQQRTGSLDQKTRVKLIIGMPALPFLLIFRRFRRQLRKRTNIDKFIMASPLVFTLLSCWAAGELLGYIETSPSSTSDPQKETS